MKTALRVALPLTALTASFGAWQLAQGAADDVRGRGRVEVQTFASVDDVDRTTARGWRGVDGLKVRLGCPGPRAATVTASLALRSGPEARIRAEAADAGVSTPSGRSWRPLEPGAVPVAASSKPRTVSFTFVTPRLPGSHGAVVRLAWRSPSGRELRLGGGSLTALWDREGSPCR
jgi:hypothetical protein